MFVNWACEAVAVISVVLKDFQVVRLLVLRPAAWVFLSKPRPAVRGIESLDMNSVKRNELLEKMRSTVKRNKHVVRQQELARLQKFTEEVLTFSYNL